MPAAAAFPGSHIRSPLGSCACGSAARSLEMRSVEDSDKDWSSARLLETAAEAVAWKKTVCGRDSHSEPACIVAQVLKSATATWETFHIESNPVSAVAEVAGGTTSETSEPVSVDIPHW